MPRIFEIQESLDLLIPDIQCYQMDLQNLVHAAIDSDHVSDDFRELPSWSKFSAQPKKSKGFFIRLLDAMFKGQGNLDELNVDLQIGNRRSGLRVAMMFVTANNHQLNEINDIATECLSSWRVVTLSGDRKFSGRKVTNSNCESIVKEEIELAKLDQQSILIISNRIAQRSFSISEVEELYLAYDGGTKGATQQKISRTLTAGNTNKIGHIFSLSFDPVRDEKFDSMIIETAINLRDRGHIDGFGEAIKFVLNTLDIFICTPGGSVKICADTYLRNALNRGAISEALGKLLNLYQLSSIQLALIARGRISEVEDDTFAPVITQKGKTYPGLDQTWDDQVISPNSDSDRGNDYEKLLIRARQVVITLMKNIDVIVLGTNSNTIEEAMKKIHKDKYYQECIKGEFGIEYEVIEYILKTGAINFEYAELAFADMRSMQ